MDKMSLLADQGVSCPIFTFGQRLKKRRNGSPRQYPFRYWAFCNIFCAKDSGKIIVTQPSAEGFAEVVDLDELIRTNGTRKIIGFTGEPPERYASFRWRLEFSVCDGEVEISFISETPMRSATLDENIEPEFGARVTLSPLAESGDNPEWTVTDEVTTWWCKIIVHLPHSKFPALLA